MTYTITIVDDEDAVKWALERELRDQGYRLLTADSSEGLFAIFAERTVELVLLDMRLNDENGIDVLKRIKEESPDTIVIMMTGFGDIETAIESIKAGAYDYVTKPFNLEELKLRIKNALDNFNLKVEVNNIRAQAKSKYAIAQIVGNSGPIQKVLSVVKKVAESKAATVLIRGESGAGKELIARAIHYSSARSEMPFIEVNCTAIPETLLESELFGHEKGAFTDAKTDRKGVLELADKGTLFLDEIGDMPEKMQMKLLRVLQERRFRRVGGSQDIEVDIRIVAATNRDLEKAVSEKEFREDLYYRLKVIPIYLPPLRERKEDIILLAEHFIKTFNKEFAKKITKIDAKAVKLLTSYSWPGNIRELKNVIERAIILESEDVIMAEHLALTPEFAAINEALTVDLSSSVDNSDHLEVIIANEVEKKVISDMITLNLEETTLEAAEKEIIKKVLSDVNWNKNIAAQKLKINRTTLYSKIKKYDLDIAQ